MLRTLLTLSLFCTGSATLAGNAADLCRAALQDAARETGVPVDVLNAVTLLETGRGTNGGLDPWPWALNVGGQGVWPATRAEAVATITRHLSGGQNSIDIGCFQINWRWHGEHFASPDALIDPRTNALYAARFLLSLYQEFGDWTRAAGAFHSRTETHAAGYRTRFAALRDTVPSPTAPVGRIRANAFPLLQGRSAAGGMGSLVPLGGAG